MTKKQTTIITALSIIAFILALLVSGRFWFRLDLTKNRAYTISKVSRNLYKEIPDPVNITYYLSNKLRTVVPAPGEIEDTLREYVAYSRGKIRLTVRDPLKSELSITVEELGLQPRQVQTVERDQASLVTVYSGIVIEYLDSIEVLPWVISTDTLEYDLTSRIRSMIMNSERWLGVIVGDSFRQWQEDFGYLNMTLAEAGYRVRQISAGEEIPDNLPALFVFGGVEEFDDWALYRIDRYIQNGGKVLFAVKGIFVDTVYGTVEARRQEDMGLLDMIASYGVTVRPELVLDQNALTLQYQARSPYGGIQYRIVRYPLWIGVLDENGNVQHPVSSGFSGLDLYWASPLELHPSSSVEAVSLFTSTPEAWTMRENLYTSPEVPYMLEREAAQTRGERILGAALSGVFPSFFSGSPKPVREGSEEELPDMPERAGQSRIIVIGDTDFATNIINATQARHNLDFLLRIADWLANDDDIIGIRSRQPQAGRLDRILDPARRAAAMKFSQVVNVGLIPLLVIAAGLTLASRRKKRSRNAEIKTVKENANDV
jgi:gliding-associated putative ABC transporter substrate-binding component GldG